MKKSRKITFWICIVSIFIGFGNLSSLSQNNKKTDLAKIETQKAYERGRQMWFDENLGSNGRSCESCHPNGFLTNAETYPRYKHILRTIATISMTHNFAIVNESDGKPWVIGSEDANAIALFVMAFANGKRLEMEEPHSINDEWILNGEQLFSSTDLGTNGASCAQCHSKKKSSSNNTKPVDLKGVVAYYPKFHPHFGRVVTLEQQINYCIESQLEGTPLELNDKKIVELYCYLADISQGTKISVAQF